MLILLLIPLIWILRRISRLQELRSFHADKEALGNTLQAVLNSGFTVIEGPACEAAVKEMFSPAHAITARKARCRKAELTDIMDAVKEIKSLMRPDEETPP